ncbi:MAG: cyclic nucleotide-binding and patatin-like phospholipase domain-containing protein [Rubrivivax sp.]|nr:cyclic nucleotide-binding and patatin-like phospholipase domain-containing protein [Rubrivivax sp.]
MPIPPQSTAHTVSPALYQDRLLDQHLAALLGPLDAEALAQLRSQLQWVEVAAGQQLMTQGEPGDCMYLSISGRLRAYQRDDSGAERTVRDMARGQVIGEMALYTDEPRSASVVAVRDSVLVRLDKPGFDALLARSPQVSVALTRQIVQRLRTAQAAQPPTAAARPVSIGLVPVTAGVQTRNFAATLAAQLRRVPGAAPGRGGVCIIDAQSLDHALGQPGLARSSAADAAANRRIALHLDEVEAAHDAVLLVADEQPTPWTERCTRRCDEMLLLADATQPPVLHATETQFLMQRPGRGEAADVLVLLHPAGLRLPSGTRAWLARRPVADHIHIRPALERDMARLARVQSRTAVGLVLAGGGARGLAHLGIAQVLQERGIEVDFIGGTSIGAVMAVLLAGDQPLDRSMAIARAGFIQNPTGDFNLLPLLSLIGGRRMRRVVTTAMQALLGGPADLEDLWKNCYCVASNYSQAREQVLSHGDALESMLASAAIPGALPPLLRDGDLLCDGGTFNNFPVDRMRARRGVGKVIGVDLAHRKPRRFESVEVPGTWALLRDRLRPRKSRRYRFPALVAYLMNISILYSSSRQAQSRRLTDLHFNPPLERVGMLQWKRFDSIVAQGREHAQQVLDTMAPEALAPYLGAPK